MGDRRTRGDSPLTPEHQPGEGVNRKEFLQLWVLVSVHLVMQAHWFLCDHDREGRQFYTDKEGWLSPSQLLEGGLLWQPSISQGAEGT